MVTGPPKALTVMDFDRVTGVLLEPALRLRVPPEARALAAAFTVLNG
jgi:hypothetical protein